MKWIFSVPLRNEKVVENEQADWNDANNTKLMMTRTSRENGRYRQRDLVDILVVGCWDKLYCIRIMAMNVRLPVDQRKILISGKVIQILCEGEGE